MLLYYWNTYAERRNAFTMVNSIGNVIRDDNSISSMSSDDTDLDNDVSLNSLSEDDDSLITLMYKNTTSFLRTIFMPVEAGDIEWGKSMLIRDISKLDAIKDFRFRKDHLQEIADKLWDKGLGLLLDGPKESIKVSHDYRVPYETGILFVLYRLAFVRQFRPEMERYFGM